jgi:23S rRNA pseudouridine1911/1915/1917 synthase
VTDDWQDIELDNADGDVGVGDVTTVNLRPAVEEKDLRLDKFVATHITDLSRGHVQRLIDDGLVTVDQVVRRQKFKVTPGQVIEVRIPPVADDVLEPEPIPLDILFEDEHIIVINKSAGLVVHPAPGHTSGTLVNAVLHHSPDVAMAGSHRPGIVHRLDRDTSGLIVVAKTDAGRLSLLEQWAEGSVVKEYLAVARGMPETDEFVIDAPIGRDPKQRNRMAVVPSGKVAVSKVAVPERFNGAFLARVHIDTGRTHQIRVHLAYAGYPIVGDHVYNRTRGMTGGETPIAERQLLHAYRLTITLLSGERREFEAPLPGDFEHALHILRDGAG